MKKILVLLCLFSFLIASVHADTIDMQKSKIDVMVDGELLETYDYEQGIDLPAFIYNSRTMLPLRSTLSLFGIEGEQISWNAEERSVSILTNEGDTIWMQIDNKQAKFNDEIVETDVPAKIFNSRTFVPVAFVSQLLGEIPTWNGETRTVTMTPSTYEISAYGLTYQLDRLLDFTKPQYNAYYKTYDIMHYDNVEYQYDAFITIENKSGDFESIIKDVAEAYYFDPESYVHLDSSYVAVKHSISEEEDIVLVNMTSRVIQLKIIGISDEMLVKFINTMEVK